MKAGFKSQQPEVAAPLSVDQTFCETSLAGLLSPLFACNVFPSLLPFSAWHDKLTDQNCVTTWSAAQTSTLSNSSQGFGDKNTRAAEVRNPETPCENVPTYFPCPNGQWRLVSTTGFLYSQKSGEQFDSFCTAKASFDALDNSCPTAY